MLTRIALGALLPTVCGLAVTVVILWDALDQRRNERDTARQERDLAVRQVADLRIEVDTAVQEVSRLLAPPQDDDATLRLPGWHEFLPAQPSLPAETVDEVLEALERHANGEGR